MNSNENVLLKELEEVTSSFKTFTTNQGSNTLEKHLKEILTEGNVKYFDVLIGYFRMTGFNKIEQYLKDIEKLRILIGINTESRVLRATELIDRFAKEQIKDWDEAINEGKYKSIVSMLRLLKDNRLKIRVSPHNDNHSKLYILRNKNDLTSRLQGGVIIGSSNLTHNGLSGNFEINTELRDNSHIDEATQIFNILWKNAEELSLKDIEERIIKKLKDYPPKPKEITKDNITPYQVYIKALQVYFNDRIDLIDFNSDDMPKEFKSFNYQSDAVQDGISKLNKYNGFYLADVVGLGKTIIAILIIKRLQLKTVVIAPSSVLNQWKKAIKDFKIENIKCISKDTIPNTSDAELIVVDEAHNFRNSDTNRYEKLENICKQPYQKKVMLLSATPQNNKPNDIAHQLYLFQNQHSSTIPNLLKLKAFFDAKNSEYEKIIKDPENDNKEKLEKISQDIKTNVLKYIMTRRTRTDIENCEMYNVDVEKFPKLNELIPLKYDLKDADLIKKYNETADDLQNNLEYARFQSLNKMNEQGRAIYRSLHPYLSDNIFDENPLEALMRTQLVKRFESSFEAFKISLDRHTRRLESFIEKFKKDEIYLGKYSNDFLDDKEDYFTEEGRVYYFKTKGKKRIKKMLSGHIFTKDDFEKDFLKLLEDDLDIFEKLNEVWEDEKRDPKLEVFKQEIKKYKDGKTKIVVFTESQDTGRYLYENLLSKELKILYIDSTNRADNVEIIAQNFDANYEKKEQKDDFNIIITTDTLAEGINLHRSNTIYNYDIPWNATKLMQRIGRINRIGSTAKTYNVFNFKPVAKSEEIIGLSHKAHTKLQSFHSTYGEDNKIYTQSEEVESKELFEIMEAQKEELDEELQFLQELRTFKDENPKEFAMIEKLEDDIKMNIKENPTAFCYKKGKTIDKFYKISNEVEEMGFADFATSLKLLSEKQRSTIDESKIEEIQKSINDYYQINTVDKEQMQHNDTQKSANDGKAIRILKDYTRKKIIDKALFKSSRELISNGVYGSLSKEIIKSTPSDIIDILTKRKTATPKQEVSSREALRFIVTYTKDV